MIGPDGSIWLCRPLRRSGGHCRARNHDSIGVSLVLNGDREQFWGTPQHKACVAVLGLLAARFAIDPRTHLGGHTRWTAKTCPGTGIMSKLRRLIREVLIYMSRSAINAKPVTVLREDGTEIDCRAQLEPDPETGEGKTRVNLREAAEGANIGVEWDGKRNAVILHAPGGEADGGA
jgi:hypothetical protein